MLKLDAINQMLLSIGQNPVTSLSSNHPAVLAAVAIFNRVNKKIQGQGWWFNTDYNLTLSYNPTTGEIILPANTLGVDPVDTTSGLVQRGNKLYDRLLTTFNVGEDVIVNIKQLLEFEDIPENAASYIAAQASYEFHRDKVGDRVKMQELKEDIHATMIEVKKDDINFNNIKLSDNPSVKNLLGGMRPSRR